MRNSETMYNSSDETDCSGRVQAFYWPCFYPLCKFVNSYEDMRKPRRACSQWPYHVQSPCSERPCQRYCLQLGSWFVWLICIELASSAMINDIFSIPQCIGPEESSTKGFFY